MSGREQISGYQGLGFKGRSHYRGASQGSFFGVSEPFCILIVVVVTPIYTCDKISQDYIF